MKHKISTTLLTILFSIASTISFAEPQKIIGAYLGADSQWQLTSQQQAQLKESLQHVTHVFYAFVRLNGSLLNMTDADFANLALIKQSAPDKPIILSVGGWGGRDEFGFLASSSQRHEFILSAVNTINHLRSQGYNIIGLDVDWENEQLASKAETDGVASLLQELHVAFKKNSPPLLVSNAVPASPAYWSNYPHAALWSKSVDFTTVMAYDHYGTFGPTAELGAGLYKPDANMVYPYTQTSGDDAVKYYASQGLSNNKILLGVPFYCHSYYVNVTDGMNTLHHLVFDPNISSQVDYSQALAQYGKALFQYPVYHNNQIFAYYGAIPIDSAMAPNLKRFMSCENPVTIGIKMDYVKNNKLAGTSFWSLMQDVPYSDSNSLLYAINKNLNTME